MPVNDGDFRLGIVGCGGTSDHHVEASLATEGVRFVACCDVRVERAQEFSDHFGCDAQYDEHLMSHQTTHF